MPDFANSTNELNSFILGSADPSMNELSSFVELAKSGTDQDGFQFDPSKVTPIPGFDASFVPTSQGGGQILQKNAGSQRLTAVSR